MMKRLLKRKLLLIPSWLLLLIACIFFFSQSGLVQAAFVSNDVMDDYEFNNTGTLNAGQIDAFLNTFPQSCISQNNGFTAPIPTGYSPAGGFTYGGNVTAGQVINAAAQVYGLNPEVLLTTLQKEQSLVTGTAGCSTLQYVGALGYGCPDGGTQYSYSGVDLYSMHGSEVTSVSGTCVNTAAKAGFSEQVIHAAWLLEFGMQRSEGNVSWAVITGNWDNSDDPQSCYTGPMTQGYRSQCPNTTPVYYDGYDTIDGVSTHMDTGATAALYWYTPHFSGNENFDSIYQSWFGATTGGGFELVISDDPSDTRQWVVYGSIKQYIPSSQILDAWGFENVPLITMPAAQLAAISTGPTLDRLMVLNGTSTVYFVDGGQRHRVPWNNILSTWNLAGRVVSSVSSGLFTLPTQGADMTYAVENPSNSTIYMPDGADSSGNTILRPYASTSVLAAWEGSASNYNTVSTDFFSTIDSDIGATLTSTNVIAGGSDYQISNGYRLYEAPAVASLFPGTPQAVSWATIGRLSVGPNVTQIEQSNDTGATYLIDNGDKHQLLWPTALSAWSTPTQAITSVNDSYLSLIPTGSSIGGYTASVGGQLYIMNQTATPVPSTLATAYTAALPPYSASAALLALYPAAAPATDFIQSPGDPSVYMLDNSGNLRHLLWASQVSAWGGYQAGITQLPSYIVNGISTANSPQLYVTDGTTNYLVDNGQKYTVSSSVATTWGLSSPQTYSDGTLSLLPTAGALGTTVEDTSGTYYLIKGGAAYATVDPNIAQDWALTGAPVMSTTAVSSEVPIYMLTRFDQWTANGTTTDYVVDNGNWYSISTAQLANLGGVGAPLTELNPSFAPNTITAWTSVVIKSTAGTYYVIDGGNKDYFTSPVILNQWTDNGALSVPTVTNGFLNLLPTGTLIERAIKGSGPSIYLANDGTKQHILYSSTYQTDYAPFANVSDYLINAMPNGSDID
jgi:hypothetical protein